jgi:hypothetical protein
MSRKSHPIKLTLTKEYAWRGGVASDFFERLRIAVSRVTPIENVLWIMALRQIDLPDGQDRRIPV